MVRYATNILWCTDGEDEDELDLPWEVRLPDWLSDDDDEIADYLSDEVGFLVDGFSVEEREDE